jgi:hypothetical protein
MCPWCCDVTTMDTSKAVMDTFNAALAQPVFGLFMPHGALSTGPGLPPSSPYPLACPGAHGAAWCCACAACFGAFYASTGPFSQALGCSHLAPIQWPAQGACRMPGVVLAQPVMGILHSVLGPFHRGDCPIPHPSGCLQLCLRSFFWLFLSPCHSHFSGWVLAPASRLFL